MTLFPAARWRGPVPNQGGSMGRILGLVLHIQEGSEAGTDAWFHNPASKVSAHFGNPKSGPLDQWVEVGTVAWAEVDGNSTWISVENEGNSGDSLTASQLENVAQLLAWLHTGYGVPLQISDSTVPGLTGHGLGGAAWGGHYDCPGAPILSQRQAIIDRAGQLLGAPTAGGTVPAIPSSIGSKWPDIAGEFTGTYDDSSAIIWADAGARAAALYARQARDTVNALAARPAPGVSIDIEQLAAAIAARIPVPAAPVVDVAALAGALAPLLNAGASADSVALAVVAHLGAKLAG